MYLDLMDILRAPGTSIERAIDLEPVDLDDVRFVERIWGDVKAANARRNLVISGQAASSVEMRCSRCLRLFAQPLSMDLEATAPVSFFRMAPNTVLPGGRGNARTDEDGEIEDEVDDETAAIFDAHSVDVLELLRQAAVLAWPIQPLCSADCAGLPEAARFKVEHVDDRWSALQALASPAKAEMGKAETGKAETGEALGGEDADWLDDVREDELADDGEDPLAVGLPDGRPGESRDEESAGEEQRN